MDNMDNSSKEGWEKFTCTSDTETEPHPQDLDLFIVMSDLYTRTQGRAQLTNSTHHYWRVRIHRETEKD